MQISGPATAGASSTPAFTVGLDTSKFVTRIASVQEARALPPGTVVGDAHGGLTFSDHVATILESRSRDGWHEVEVAPGGERWTLIVVDR